jgi:hypothetical protein
VSVTVAQVKNAPPGEACDWDGFLLAGDTIEVWC